jgi:hypothetical protein
MMNLMKKNIVMVINVYFTHHRSKAIREATTLLQMWEAVELLQ